MSQGNNSAGGPPNNNGRSIIASDIDPRGVIVRSNRDEDILLAAEYVGALSNSDELVAMVTPLPQGGAVAVPSSLGQNDQDAAPMIPETESAASLARAAAQAAGAAADSAQVAATAAWDAFGAATDLVRAATDPAEAEAALSARRTAAEVVRAAMNAARVARDAAVVASEAADAIAAQAAHNGDAN